MVRTLVIDGTFLVERVVIEEPGYAEAGRTCFPCPTGYPGQTWNGSVAAPEFTSPADGGETLVQAKARRGCELRARLVAALLASDATAAALLAAARSKRDAIAAAAAVSDVAAVDLTTGW